MTYDDNIQAIRRIISAATGLSLVDVIPNFDNSPTKLMPQGQYCSVDIHKPRRWGAPHLEYTDDDLNQSIVMTTRYIFPVNLNFYRDGVLEYSVNMDGCEWDPDVDAVMWATGVGIRKVEENNNTTALNNGDKYEDRAHVYMEFYGVVTKARTNGNIQEVSFEVSDEDDNIIGGGELPDMENK